MNVVFKETMSGTWVAPDGGQAPMVFTTYVRAKSPLAFLNGDAMALDGTITVGGIARDAPMTGTLEVKVLTAGEMVYSLEFAGKDGAKYSFSGKKDVELGHPISGMITLRGTLYRGDAAIGTATVTFSLRDIPKFLASFRPG